MAIHDDSVYKYTVAHFYHRIATLVADKLRRWFTLGIKTNWGSLSKPHTGADS